MVPSARELDLDHLGDRLQPGQLVRVVLVGARQDHGRLLARDGVRQAVLALERLGDTQPSSPTSLFTAAVAPLPTKSTTSSASSAHAAGDDAACLLRGAVVARPAWMALWTFA